MRGCIISRYAGSYTLVLDLGPGLDKHGVFKKRRQQTETFRGSRKEAEDRMALLVRQVNRDEYVKPSKLTLAEWLRGEYLLSLERRVGRDLKPTTLELYRAIITRDLAPSTLGSMKLQKVRPMDVERYFAGLDLATSSMDIQRNILSGAFKAAAKNRLVEGTNPVKDADRIKAPSTRPRRQREPSAWTAGECQTFLEAAKLAGTQPAAMYALALDSGCRKGELLGLRWSDVDLEAANITIAQQLLSNTPVTFGPPKNGKPRTVDLDGETVRLLAVHRKAQARIGGLCFTDDSGEPLKVKSIGQGEFARIVEDAGIKPIRFHDMRHTTATLLLLAGEPVHVVSRRLGHATVTVTLNRYSHVLDQQSKQAGRTIGGLIHGAK